MKTNRVSLDTVRENYTLLNKKISLNLYNIYKKMGI